MSKVVKGVGKIGGSLLGIASLIPGPQQPFLAAGSLGLGLLGGIGGGGKKGGNQQLEALQFIAQLMQRPPPLSQTVRGGTAPRILSFGRVNSAGVSFLRENTPSKLIYIEGIYLCDGPFSGLDAIICDDELVPLSNASFSATAPILYPTAGIKSTGGFGIGYIVVEIVNGTPQGKLSELIGGPASYLVSNSGSDWPPFWDETHLGKGCSILYTISYRVPSSGPGERLTVYPNGFPEFQIIYRGARVYDPRDPGQTFSEASFDIYNETWKFSENPALCAAHYVNWLILQNLTAISGINWETIKEAANDCDRLAPISRSGFNAGTQSYEPFARISALITLDMEPRDVLKKLMESCDGDWGIDQNGRFTMWINKWVDPSVVFDGRDIGDFVEEFGAPSNEQVNYMHVSYMETRQGGNRVETAIYRNRGSEDEIGRRTGAVVFDWVTSPDQAYRLAARQVRRNARKRRLSVSLGARAMTALQQRVVGINAPEVGLIGTFRVDSLAPADATMANWQAELTEVSEDQFSDEAIPADPITGLSIVNQPAIGTPTVMIASAISTGPDVGVAQLSLDANMNQPFQASPDINAAALRSDPSLQLDGRYSTDGGATWTNFDVLLSALIMQTAELARGSVVTMQARFVSPAGAVGSYSSSVTATIP